MAYPKHVLHSSVEDKPWRVMGVHGFRTSRFQCFDIGRELLRKEGEVQGSWVIIVLVCTWLAL